MARATAKVAISLERELFRRAERLRATTGESRSALIGRALRNVLQAEADKRNVEEYVAAYRRIPDGSRDVTLARRTARRALASLPWEDE